MEKKKPTLIKHVISFDGISCCNLNVSTINANPPNNFFLLSQFQVMRQFHKICSFSFFIYAHKISDIQKNGRKFANLL